MARKSEISQNSAIATGLVDDTLNCVAALLNYIRQLTKEDATAVVLRVVALAARDSEKAGKDAIEVLVGSHVENCFSRWLLSELDRGLREKGKIDWNDCVSAQGQNLREALLRLIDATASVSACASDCAHLLGRLYEELLDYTFVLSGGVWSWRIVSAAKKRGGNFFTPSALAAVCVERALEPLVYFDNDGKRLFRGLREILALKVLDPACGGGAFLLSALDYLVNTACQSGGIAETDVARLRRIIAKRCLYGVDLDPIAAEVTRLALWLSVQPCGFEVPPRLAFRRVKSGNALLGAWRSQLDTYPAKVWRSSKPIEVASAATKSEKAHVEVAADLRQRMDAWSALWFWPSTDQALLPSQNELLSPSEAAQKIISSVVERRRFFHWEVEYPRVFSSGAERGFDAIVSNPPWEIEKPNSREFFSRFDPDYWTYGKQAATKKQKELFEQNAEIKAQWEQHCYDLKAMSRWLRCSRLAACGETPYRLQSHADINAYKMFVEQSLFLLNRNGRIGMILPSNIYTDQGTVELRRHLLQGCALTEVLSFENRDGTFPIHRSFKFCVLVATKGGATEGLRASFAGTFSNWLKGRKTFDYPKGSVEQFSPKWNVLLELGHHRDLQVLEGIYRNSVLVGDDLVDFSREFDMTNDSGAFLLRDELENQGVFSDVYGNWLQGRWRNYDKNSAGSRDDVILSDCSTRQICIDEIDAVMLPVYEGRMVGQFDASQKAWCAGKGRRADWRTIDFANKKFAPQYLMQVGSYRARYPAVRPKLGFLAIGSATNTRSMVCSALPDFPCGNSVGVLRPHTSLVVAGLTELELSLVLSCCFNSFVFDFALRTRLGGTNLNYFVLEECPLPNLSAYASRNGRTGVAVLKALAAVAAKLTFIHRRFAPDWLDLINSDSKIQAGWAVQDDERLRLRCTIETLVAHLYGISESDFEFIMRECDLPVTTTASNPKGFWRVDKNLEPHRRTTVQSLRSYKQFLEMGMQLEPLLNCIELALPAASRQQLERDSSMLTAIINKAQGRFEQLVTIIILVVGISILAAAPSLANPQIALVGQDNKTAMEDGKALWESLRKQVGSWKEYRADVSLTLYKGGDAKETKSRVYWRSSEEIRIEVIAAGFKSGSVMVKHKDGHVRIHGGPMLAFVKMTVDPDSRLLKMDNGRNVTKASIPNLVIELSEEMKSGLKCLVSSSAEIVDGLPPVLEFQVLNQDGSLSARVLVTSDKHIPVRWERFSNGKPQSKATLSGLTIDPGLADNLFQLD